MGKPKTKQSRQILINQLIMETKSFSIEQMEERQDALTVKIYKSVN